ncbi:MAG: indole-3-glycerol phosphate synthase TrpC [Acidobacteria bacterium]|nr:indole-3-glycerol phosphate synthase TrpC [Acidobacteriota bacterium]
MDVLERIVRVKKERLAQRGPVARWRGSKLPGRFSAALRENGVRIIAEIKKASPSRGRIRDGADPIAVARAYASHGAAAISVLTEEDHFLGSMEDLRGVRHAVDLPLLCKDFFVAESQFDEAAGAGADAVLLIASLLPGTRLREFLAMAAARGVECLVEVHTEEERDQALEAGSKIIGINSRDLRTFEVDLDLCGRLIQPQKDALWIAESGIRTQADVARLRRYGFRAFLIGEELMRQPDPGRALAQFLGDDADSAS